MTKMEHELLLPSTDHDLSCIAVLKCADISNVSRPFSISQHWALLLLAEFLAQGDRERAMGLTITAGYDRRRKSIWERLCAGQNSFIDAFASPLFKLVSERIPGTHAHHH